MRASPLILVSVLVACGPVGPMEGANGSSTPPAAGTDSGSGGSGGATGGDGGSGSGGGVTVTSTPPSGGQAPGGQTRWAHKMGGLGVEYTQDVAVAPDGSVVAFNVIGVRGESLEQIGFVHIGGDGNEFDAEFENESGAALHFAPAGSFVIAPSGAMDVAAAGRCSGGICPTIGGHGASGGVVVSLSSRAAFGWQHALPGDVVSNLDVDGHGDLLVVAAAPSGGVARALHADGSVAWERIGFDAGVTSAVALDGSGGGWVANGASVVRLDSGGAQAWQRTLGTDVVVLAVRPSANGAIVHGRYRGSLALGASRLTAPSGADHGYFVAELGADGSPRWATDLGVVQETSDAAGPKTLLAVGADGIVLVTGADACTAAVVKLDGRGAPRWRRPLVPNGCGGRGILVHGLAIAPTGQILVGGAMSASVDFGSGTLEALATDGFVVSLAP